jgi:hypothetical protein
MAFFRDFSIDSLVSVFVAAHIFVCRITMTNPKYMHAMHHFPTYLPVFCAQKGEIYAQKRERAFAILKYTVKAYGLRPFSLFVINGEFLIALDCYAVGGRGGIQSPSALARCMMWSIIRSTDRCPLVPLLKAGNASSVPSCCMQVAQVCV